MGDRGRTGGAREPAAQRHRAVHRGGTRPRPARALLCRGAGRLRRRGLGAHAHRRAAVLGSGRVAGGAAPQAQPARAAPPRPGQGRHRAAGACVRAGQPGRADPPRHGRPDRALAPHAAHGAHGLRGPGRAVHLARGAARVRGRARGRGHRRALGRAHLCAGWLVLRGCAAPPGRAQRHSGAALRSRHAVRGRRGQPACVLRPGAAGAHALAAPAPHPRSHPVALPLRGPARVQGQAGARRLAARVPGLSPRRARRARGRGRAGRVRPRQLRALRPGHPAPLGNRARPPHPPHTGPARPASHRSERPDGSRRGSSGAVHCTSGPRGFTSGRDTPGRISRLVFRSRSRLDLAGPRSMA